jgi:hypothetical protein
VERVRAQRGPLQNTNEAGRAAKAQRLVTFLGRVGCQAGIAPAPSLHTQRIERLAAPPNNVELAPPAL